MTPCDNNLFYRLYIKVSYCYFNELNLLKICHSSTRRANSDQDSGLSWLTMMLEIEGRINEIGFVKSVQFDGKEIS